MSSSSRSVFVVATLLQPVATPAFSPSAGTYTGPVTVTISGAISGATIHYTTDGTSPTTSSAIYTGPIFIKAITTIKTMAASSGMADSDVASATYTIRVAPPMLIPPGARYLTILSGTQAGGE